MSEVLGKDEVDADECQKPTQTLDDEDDGDDNNDDDDGGGDNGDDDDDG